MARLREMRGGHEYDADFRHRMKGEGVWAQLMSQRMRKAAARHGLNRKVPELDMSLFDRAALHAPDLSQPDLF